MRAQRAPYGSLLKGDPLGKNAKGDAKPAAKDKPAKVKKGRRK